MERSNDTEKILERILSVTKRLSQSVEEGNLQAGSELMGERGILLAEAVSMMHGSSVDPGNGTLHDIVEENARMVELLVIQKTLVAQKIQQTRAAKKIASYYP